MKLATARATFEQHELPVAAAIDDDKKSAWAVDAGSSARITRPSSMTAPVGFERDGADLITLEFNSKYRPRDRPAAPCQATAAAPVASRHRAWQQERREF